MHVPIRGISDDTGRIAMREVLNPDFGSDGSEAELTRYIYSNHLQSATLELDEAAAVISYEEYHPYGTTAYQAYSSLINATAKRYRYTGKERDEESGLYYHGARYCMPWLCRWCSVDPLESKYAGMSPYNYSFNNPVMYNDPSGADPKDWLSYKAEKSKTQSISNTNTISMPPINTGGRVDNTRDVRGENAEKVVFGKVAVVRNRAIAENKQMIRNIRLGERFTGQDENGQSYNMSRREITQAEYESNEAWGEAIRGGLGGALGSLLGGKEGARKGQVVDGVAMAFASVGTPFGKLENNRPLKLPFTPNIGEKAYTLEVPPNMTQWASSKINAIRKNLASPGAEGVGKSKNIAFLEGIAGSTNVAFLEALVEGASANSIGISGQANRKGAVNVPFDRYFATISTGNNNREFDAEAKLLENFAQQYYQTPQIHGSLILASERPLCVSCSGVVSQFQKNFPNVKVYLINGIK